MAKQNINKELKLRRIFLFIVLDLIILFYVFHGSDNKSNFDEEKCIRKLLSLDNYEVIDVRLGGTSAYMEMNASSKTKGNFNWTSQVWNGMTSANSCYEAGPNLVSTYIVVVHTPQEVCSYRLGRTTLTDWNKASEIDVLGNTTTFLFNKMENEIKNSEMCS